MNVARLKSIAESTFGYKPTESEIEDIFTFVQDCLEERKKETEINEPYATKAIQRMETARLEVYDLVDIIYNDEEDS